MPVIDVVADSAARTLTITAHFAAPPERLWALAADASQIAQVWGPPTHPATFVQHALAVGGRSDYFMTGPDGERFYGWWQVTAVDEPTSFAFDDGFADEHFVNNPDLPVSHNVFRFDADTEGTTATFVTTYDTAQDLQTVLDMGMTEGSTLAINQIDGFLSAATG